METGERRRVATPYDDQQRGVATAIREYRDPRYCLLPLRGSRASMVVRAGHCDGAKPKELSVDFVHLIEVLAAVLAVELESAPRLTWIPTRASPRKLTLDHQMPTFERPAIVEWNRSQALVTRASHRPRSSEPKTPITRNRAVTRLIATSCRSNSTRAPQKVRIG